MSSIIKGYNYDIFISYRQKDNKGDKWVSEFVDALKTELESTFKEEISVYFDESLEDRLQETHQVNKSLEGKLKCVIFIPILSQTYCDPDSYAWKNEFLSFLRSAESDSLGKDVTLRGGNVASRVLPVRIHDLEEEDIKLFEKETGSVLRAMDFVFKTASGVNRPLNAHEEHPHDNLNKTYYNDQINKVAQAVKEIFTAIRRNEPRSEEVAEKHAEPVTTPGKRKKTPIITGSIIALVLIILGILFLPKLFKPSEELEKSIAVLPFKNDSPDQEGMYFINGTMEAILDNLCKIEDLRVPGRTSVEQYRDNPKPIPAIAKEMDVSYILEGSGHRDGNNVRLFVQLLEGKTDKHIWSKSYDADITDIFSLQSEIAQKIASEIQAVITPEEIERIENVPTISLTAYDLYQRGRDEHWNGNIDRAEELYHKALDSDPAFAQAYNGLAQVYWNRHGGEEYLTERYLDSVLILTDIALSYNPDLSETHVIRGQYYVAHNNPDQAIIEFDKALKLNPNEWMAYAGKANLYSMTERMKAIENLHKAISLNRGQGLAALLRNLSAAYYFMGFEKQCQKYAQQYLELTGDSIRYYFVTSGQIPSVEQIQGLLKAYRIDSTRWWINYRLGEAYLFLGNYKEALKYLEKRLMSGWRDNDSYHRLGLAYWYNGDKEKAEYYIDKQFEIALAQINLGRTWVSYYYSYYDLAGICAFRGEKDKAFEYLRMFNQKKIFGVHIVNFMHTDPFFDSIRDEPEFQQITREVEAKYQAEHERTRKWLEENNML